MDLDEAGARHAEAPVDTPPPPRDDRTRWVAGGFAAGFAAGLAVTAVLTLGGGWEVLPLTLVWNSIFFPAFGAVVGNNQGRARRDPATPRPRPRVTAGACVFLVAYAGLLFALWGATDRVAHLARAYRVRAGRAEFLAKTFDDLARTEETKAREARRRVPLLRAGSIPETLAPGQKDVLRALDGTATPAYRLHRYGLIADAEEWAASVATRNAGVFRRLTAYHRALASRYRQARRRPWLPVAPDPPPPTT